MQHFSSCTSFFTEGTGLLVEDLTSHSTHYRLFQEDIFTGWNWRN